MKILIYGINFAPEPLGVGRYTGEMAAMLSRAGHDVRVVTALPYYPDWKVSDSYSAWRYAFEDWEGIKVSRAPLWVPQFPKGRERVLHLLSFALASVPLMIRASLWRPDLVWMAAPSLVCAPIALAAARLAGAKSWMHVQDFEVDVAFELSVITGGRARRAINMCERWLLSRFSKVSTISKGMMARALDKGVDRKDLLSVPNWVDLDGVSPLERRSLYRDELRIEDDALVALYSGSMGTKQAIDWLAEIALRFQSNKKLVFVFCGEGEQKAVAQAACGHLSTVRFMPLQPLNRLGELLGMADIHLLPQRPNAGTMVMPSKLTGMLASSRPVLAMADEGSELADVVARCGVVVRPGDLAGFSEGLQALCDDPYLRSRLGKEGRAYANAHLSSTSVLARLESEMRLLVAGPEAERRDAECVGTLELQIDELRGQRSAGAETADSRPAKGENRLTT